MKRGGPVTGSVTLVMIFSVLCLAVFAVLSFSSAEQDRTLAELTEQRMRDYYGADRRAVLTAAALRDGARELENVTFTEREGDLVAAFEEPLNETQTLKVELLLGDGTARILRWQTVYSGEWEADESLVLWDGN